MKDNWSPESWQTRPTFQQPSYADLGALEHILRKIRRHPPLVMPQEIEALKQKIAMAERGEAFILQGGDCAERFEDCEQDLILNKAKIILQMSLILQLALDKPIIRVGRIAGQYAKPRSNLYEEINNETLPVYRGDMVNSFAPNKEARQHDPNRLLVSYYTSALTLNYIRALSQGGFFSFKKLLEWRLPEQSTSTHKRQYEETVCQVNQAIQTLSSLANPLWNPETEALYVSHEGLILSYEQQMTRRFQNRFYNTGAHMLWLGERTRQLECGHIEYFRGIANPIGVKIGPDISTEQLISLIKILNSQNEPGRLVLITRLGATKVYEVLPSLIETVKKLGYHVSFMVDPMHGNALLTEQGIKTRDFEKILEELRASIIIHQELKSHLAGVHFELTADFVTECIGGCENISFSDLEKNYQSFCDPRLNYSQSLEMAYAISHKLTNLPSK